MTFSKWLYSLPLSSPAAHHFVHSSCLIAGSFGKRFCSSVCVLNLAQKLLIPAAAIIGVGSFVRSAGVGQEAPGLQPPLGFSSALVGLNPRAEVKQR